MGVSAMGIGAIAASMALSLGAQGSGELARIDASIKRARTYIADSPELAGTRSFGERALALLAILRGGASFDDSRIDIGLRKVLTDARGAIVEDYGGSYHAGLLLMLLEELGEKSRIYSSPDLTALLVRRLLDLQLPSGGWGDVSRTEFAVLGLDAAEHMGVVVSGEIWRRIGLYLTESQRADGGWGYRSQDKATGSMTVGGLIGLHCSGESPAAIAEAMKWLSLRFRTDENPNAEGLSPSSGGPSHRFYYLAGIAALHRVSNSQSCAEWLRAAAEGLVEEQQSNGSWLGDASDCPTSFATLVLVESRRALARRGGNRSVALGIYSPSGGEMPPLSESVLSGCFMRWTDMRSGVAYVSLIPEAGNMDEYGVVVLLSGSKDELTRSELRSLSDYVLRGGTVLIEGRSGAHAGGAEAIGEQLARSISAELPDCGTDQEEGSGVEFISASRIPGIVGDATPQTGDRLSEILVCRDPMIRILVAPRGLVSLVGSPGLGVRSATARAAVRVLVHALTR